MTKSNRHKRQRKQEKAKTQLTGVKKLSKPQNVVEPTLRVKKIIIREQLKTSSLPPLFSERGNDVPSCQITDAASEADSGVNRWKQSVQELLTSSNHHNVNMKKDAIVGLQEIASSKSTAIIRHLDKILVKIAALTMDQDSTVRKENIKLSAMILSMISEDQLRPFWSMMIAHLKCTLTHLDLAVRCNVLLFIELLVDHHPHLVYESNSVLLPGLLGLISTTSKERANTSKKQKNVTKLKTEITGKHDDITIRLKVLRLLSKCLKLSCTVLQDEEKSQGTGRVMANASAYLALRYPFGYCWDQSEEKGTKFSSSSYPGRFYSTITSDPFTSSFSSEVNKTNTSWNDFVNSCLPVIIETWVEVGLSNGEDQTKQKSGKKNKKQTGFAQIGSDKDESTNMGRRNGMHILNDSHVEALLNVTTLFEQLLQNNGMFNNSLGGDDDLDEHLKSVKVIKNVHGQNLMKYYFGILPYEPLKESRRKDVTVVNLKLFLIAGKLKMLDNNLKNKLQTFIEGILLSKKLEEDHCRLTLDVIRLVDVKKSNNLSTKFLKLASKMGHHKLITKFLNQIIHPASYELHKDKTVQDFMASLQWNEIVSELVDCWPMNNDKFDKAETQYLFELLTFIALRKLADVKSIIQACIPKLKELVSTSELKVRDCAHRAFVYADADNLFQVNFQST